LGGIGTHDPVFEQAKTVNALDRPTAVIGVSETDHIILIPEDEELKYLPNNNACIM
jgi:hypothetical protein